MIRVLLADDHRIVRAGIRRIVEESGDVEVVAEAADGKEAIQKVQDTAPDVAVIDISSRPGPWAISPSGRRRSSWCWPYGR